MALTLDKTFTKPEILTRYLNLVSFGNGAFGVQDAAQTYFGINASELNWQQAALLAGMVQSTSTLNPYTNPEGALERRNVVLDTMIENIPDAGRRAARGQGAAAGRPAAAQGAAPRLHRRGRPRVLLRLRAGVPGPRRHQQGTGRQGRLPDQDHPRSRRAEPGQVGDRRHRQPRPRRRRQRDERDQAGQGVPPGAGDGQQPHLRAEHRRRRNHAAAAVLARRRRRGVDLQDLHHRRRAGDGHGHQRPARRARSVRGQGPGQRRRARLPDGDLVRAERRRLPRLDERHRRAGHVAQHRVRQADLRRSACSAPSTWRSSWACGPTRCPAPPATTTRESNESLADFIKRQNLGSFTLGPIEVNPLELSNVAATLASGGMWCPPNPIDEVYRPQRQARCR